VKSDQIPIETANEISIKIKIEIEIGVFPVLDQIGDELSRAAARTISMLQMRKLLAED
jgi:hypothetical protein